MKLDQTLTCQRCQYLYNPLEVKKCVVCGYPLKTSSKTPASPQSNSSKSNTSQLHLKSQLRQSQPRLLTWRLLIFVTLSYFLFTVLIGGVYLFWQHRDLLEPLTSKLGEGSFQKPGMKSYRTMSAVPNVPAGLFNYGGATCFAALTKYGMNEAIANAHPDYQLRYTEPLNSKPGCSTGIEMLLNSELSFAQNGRPLKDSEYAKAQSRNFTLQQIPVAIDGIVFFVNPQLPLSGLSINQLKDIFQGKITNWQQVGGPNLPIVALSQDPTVHITINSLLNNGEQLGSDVKIVRDYTTAMRQVATTPGGISYSSAAIARGQKSIKGIGLAMGDSNQYVPPFTEDGQVNLAALRNGSYPLTRRLFVVVRQDSTIDEQAGIAYANLLLTTEGQQIVQKAGFVPLH